MKKSIAILLLVAVAVLFPLAGVIAQSPSIPHEAKNVAHATFPLYYRYRNTAFLVDNDFSLSGNHKLS